MNEDQSIMGNILHVDYAVEEDSSFFIIVLRLTVVLNFIASVEDVGCNNWLGG